MGGIKAPPDYARRMVRKALAVHIAVHVSSWIGFLIYLKVLK